MNARFNKPELVQRIRRIAAYRDRITLTCLDAADLLRRLLPSMPPRSLLYLDPPYFVKGPELLYADFYEPADHAEVARILQASDRYWMVSYDDAPQIRRLYKEQRRRAYGLNYSAADRAVGAEVLFFSGSIKIPRVPNPVSVENRDVLGA